MARSEQLMIIWDRDAAWTNNLVRALEHAEASVTSANPRDYRQELDRSQYAGIVVLAEFGQEGYRRLDFDGLELLALLRAELLVRCPIVVCSFFAKSKLIRRYPLLRWSQHHPFVRLPEEPKEIGRALEAAHPIDDDRWPHLLSYCDPLGRIERLLTHGDGLREVWRWVSASEPQLENRRTIEQDAALLRRYLLADGLPEAVHQTGRAVEKALKGVLRNEMSAAAWARAQQQLLEAVRRAARVRSREVQLHQRT